MSCGRKALGAAASAAVTQLPGIPVLVKHWFYALTLSLALGAIFDEIAAMLITLPFVLPVIEKLGFDPVWWGIVNVVVVELGMIIPPIGIIVFVLHGLAPQVPIRTIYKGVMPFIAADLLLLAMLVVFPGLVMWLPTLIRG